METTGTLTPEELLDAGRRTIDRKALQKTIKDIFSYRNPLRQFMENYRFNVIRWSATNLRKPSLWKRAGLFFNTGGIPGILRENFRQNRADLLARWERGVIGDINRSLIRLGSIPLSSKPRDLSRQLKDISRKIYRMTTYDRCPSLLQESLLLSTYEYIFASPHERKFGKLCPDEICGMLLRNGVPQESLCYQNYESILAGRETVLYEFTSDGKATLYLKPMDHGPYGDSSRPDTPFPRGKHGEYAAAFREDRENKESPERRETRQRSREVEETSPNRIIHKQQIIT